METYYFTLDSEGTKILENASIWAIDADNQAEAVAKFKQKARDIINNHNDFDFNATTMEPGHFGDCWIRTHTDPAKGGIDTSPFSSNEIIYIREPGSHPGGHVWWIEPSHSVYVFPRLIQAI